jgi:ParB-like chromosome segregation protein Spo0J
MQKLEEWPIENLIEYDRNPRKNDHAVDRMAAAIREFGFKVPIVAKSDGTVVDGHLRLKAAKKLKLENVPVLLADDLSDAQIKAFRLSVNKMSELAEWDDELLRLELEDLKYLDFDIDLTGFDALDLEGLLEDEPVGSSQNTGIDYKEQFSIIVECTSQQNQEDLYNQLTDLGLNCKVLVN